MDRCPNCGAPVRSGAKFCTTCGFQLSVADDAPSTGGAWSGGAGEPTPATPLSDAGADPMPVEAPEAVGSDTVSDAPRTDEASSWMAAATSAWPPSWEAPTAPTTALDADGIEASPSPAGEVPESNASPPAMVDARSEDEGERGDPGAADPLATARALVEELRDLLPAVAAGAGFRPAPNLDGVAADLDAARRQPDAARSREFDALRAALEHARDRPRDVDTMLDLVGRVAVVLALLDAHDRYATAIDRAVAALRRGGIRQTGGER